MATVNYSVPDDVRDPFNQTFKDQNKSAVIAELMREAVERVHRQERGREAIDRILARHAYATPRSQAELENLRTLGRP